MTSQASVAEITEKSPCGYTNSMDEILALIKGRVPIIWVLTHEENRFIGDFKKHIAQKHNRQMWVWSGYQGLIRAQGQMGIQKASGDELNTHILKKCLECIATMPKAQNENKGICYIMRDMHIALPEDLTRQLRDMFEHLIGHNKTIIIVSPHLAHGAGGNQSGLPPTMEKHISVVNYELPDEERIRTRIIDILDQMKQSVGNKDKKIKLEYADEELTVFARALRGLTLLEVDNAVSTSMTHLKELHIEKLINEKKQIVSRDDILEFVTDPVKMKDIGGLDILKDYLNKYRRAHTDEARAFGVEPLKGVILAGVPGSGKSLSAKMIGWLWKVPLLRLDIGKVMGSLVGQSEAKMRQAINQIEAMAPCVTGDTVISTASHGDITVKDLHAILTSEDATEITIDTFDPINELYEVAQIETVIRRSAENKKLLQITTSNGRTIKVTENHKLLVRYLNNNTKWVEAQYLTKGTELVEFDSK